MCSIPKKSCILCAGLWLWLGHLRLLLLWGQYWSNWFSFSTRCRWHACFYRSSPGVTLDILHKGRPEMNQSLSHKILHMHCITYTLYCIADCIVLYCIVMYCIVLYCTVLSSALLCPVLRCAVWLYCIQTGCMWCSYPPGLRRQSVDILFLVPTQTNFLHYLSCILQILRTFSASLALCEGNPSATSELASPIMQRFHVNLHKMDC